MTVEASDFFRNLPDVLRARTIRYFSEELALEARPATETPVLRNRLRLPDSSVTAIMGLSGSLHVLVAFSFSSSLADHVFRTSTAELAIAPEEKETMMNESTSEVINLVIGHSMEDLDRLGDTISLSPPAVISEGRQLHRPRDACFSELAFSTDQGMLNVFFIAPPDLFDETLQAAGNGT